MLNQCWPLYCFGANQIKISAKAMPMSTWILHSVIVIVFVLIDKEHEDEHFHFFYFNTTLLSVFYINDVFYSKFIFDGEIP